MNQEILQIQDWKQENEIVATMSEEELDRLYKAKAESLFYMARSLVNHAIKATQISMSDELQEVYDTDIENLTWREIFSAAYFIYVLHSVQYHTEHEGRINKSVFGVTDPDQQCNMLLKTCLMSFISAIKGKMDQTSILKAPGAPPLCEEAKYALDKVQELPSLTPDLSMREKMNYLIFLPLAIMKQLQYAEATLTSIHHKPTLN